MSAGDCASPVRIVRPRLRKGLPGFPISFPRVSNERQKNEFRDAALRVRAYCPTMIMHAALMV